VDAIVHFAAETHVDRSISDATPFLRTNVVGTGVLLDVARTRGVGCFVHVSTDEVYGSLESGHCATEEFPLRQTSPYAASKAASDLLALAYARTHGLDAVVTRCSNNPGPLQFPEKLIPLFITNALADEPLPLRRRRQRVRDWIHVEDTARRSTRYCRRGDRERCTTSCHERVDQPRPDP
jgi:dTDP-glucose 4,6-dehydratase